MGSFGDTAKLFEAIDEGELKSKLEDFYKVLGWDYPNENDAKAGEFFGF